MPIIKKKRQKNPKNPHIYTKKYTQKTNKKQQQQIQPETAKTHPL